MTLLSVSDLTTTYTSGRSAVHAVDGVSLEIARGETIGLVGESGCGKSTLGKTILRLVEPSGGRILFDGEDLTALSEAALRSRRKRLQMVFQDPFASLNPRRKAIDLVAQGPIVHGTPRDKALSEARELFQFVGLDPSAADRLPHEFSGGQRQRIGLARALALKPDVLVADEPVSALDVSVQAQVLRLLTSLRERLGLSIIFITHDLRVAAQICDLVAVMKDGVVVEHGLTHQVFGTPQHAYTRALLDAIPGGDFARTPHP